MRLGVLLGQLAFPHNIVFLCERLVLDPLFHHLLGALCVPFLRSAQKPVKYLTATYSL